MWINGQDKQTLNSVYIAGIENKRFNITIENGIFTSIQEAKQEGSHYWDSTAESLWISPGFIDLHTHMAWTDFDHADQLKRSPAQVEQMQAEAFAATLRTGVTTVRDAGGLPPALASHLTTQYKLPLRVETSSAMLGADDAKGITHLEKVMNGIFETGAEWIKIMATGGLGSPSDQVLNPIFSEEEFRFIVSHAHAHQKKVMVHTWGGITIDWSIAAQVESIEHGMFLTADQAEGLAEQQVAFVPTTSIYRIAADPKGVLQLPQVICDRAAYTAEAHAKAVVYAKKAGVTLGMGTDYATPYLHGYNLQELDTLIEAGLTRQEAIQTATENAAQILGRGPELGKIAEGYISDAVLFNTDPYQVDHMAKLQKHITSVLIGKR